MRIFFLLTLFILINRDIYSQQNCALSILGKVLDNDTKKPLSGVLIKIIDSQKFTTTDEDGNFSFDNLCSYNFKSIISRYGYNDSIFQNNEKNVTIYLYICKYRPLDKISFSIFHRSIFLGRALCKYLDEDLFCPVHLAHKVPTYFLLF